MRWYRVDSYQLTKYATVRKPSGPPPILAEVEVSLMEMFGKSTAANAARTALISRRFDQVYRPSRSLGCICVGSVMLEGGALRGT